MNTYEKAKGSSFIRRLGENRIIFVARVSVLFTAWIVLSALISLLLVVCEYVMSRLIGFSKKRFKRVVNLEDISGS